MERVDLIVHSARQLVTCAADQPKRRQDLRELGIIAHGAVAIHAGLVVAVGSTAEILAAYQARDTLDASDRVVCPGLIDPHTHTVYAGDRLDEFEQRIAGASYLEIMAAGGGIQRTVNLTRQASLDQLIAESRERLDVLLQNGTTTAEIKTGYGLSLDHELKLLEAIEHLAQTHPIEIVPTFLGAHTIPAEYRDQSDVYVDLVVDEMLPQVARWYQGSWFAHFQPDVPWTFDIFCEQHAFTLAQTERILRAGVRLGMRPKLHADQFSSLGAVPLALQFGALSVDHLEVITPQDQQLLAQSSTIGVLIPAANVNLGLPHHAPARQMVEAGVALALCTDLNPGSAPCLSLPLVMALACRFMKLLPAETLNATTINAAYALDCASRLGSLEVGKQADLLILTSTDYRHLSYYMGGQLVDQVIKSGRVL